MILGVGVDIVQVSRFESWQKYSKEQLLRVFSEQELDDCCRQSSETGLNEYFSTVRPECHRVLRYNLLRKSLRMSGGVSKESKMYNLEKLASRFAAKEAFFKALSSALVKLKLSRQTFSFLFSCNNLEVIKGEWDIPQLRINWKSFEKKIGEKIPELQVDLSISHEKNNVVAFVIISL